MLRDDMRTRSILARLLVLVLFATWQTALATENPSAFQGRDLYADLAKTEPDAYAAISKAASAVINGQSLYWKIVPPNGAKPSFLLGTAHVTDPRVATLPKAMLERIRKSNVAVFELAETANRVALIQAAFSRTDLTHLPDGKSLWDYVPDSEEAAVRAHPRVVLIPAAELDRMQPWLISLMMTYPPCEFYQVQSNLNFDEKIAQMAQFERVSIKGLETVGEQLESMASMSLEDQAAMFKDNVTKGISPEDSFQTTVELYLQNKVTALEPLMAHFAARKGVDNQQRMARFMKTFIDKRNINMADRVTQYLDGGAPFVAVGALHLPGEVGVVELLRKKGYKVTPAKRSQ